MEGMYMFPPHGERKRNNIFTAWNQCVSTRNKHLYNIYMYFLDFFFLSSFCPVVKRVGFCTERLFITTRNILHIFLSGRERNKKICLLVKSSKMKVKLWTAIAMWKNRDTTQQGPKTSHLSAAHHETTEAHLSNQAHSLNLPPMFTANRE